MKKFAFILLTCLLAAICQAQSDQTSVSVSTYEYVSGLELDFYSSAKIDSNRPLIVLVHGGGFASGRRDGPREKSFSMEMASRGYAVASMSYRLTRKGEENGFGCNCPSSDKLATFVAAVDDVSEALAFLIQNEDVVFDRDKVVLMGSSAGAETILNAAFMKGHYLFRDIDFHPIAGVISLAGAMVDVRYLNEHNAVAGLFVHGAEDRLVPYGTAAHHYCNEEAEGYLQLDGSVSISNKLDQLNESYILAYDPHGNHDWANLGYELIDLVCYFMDELIIGDNLIQQKVLVGKDKH